jgi:phosphatidylglycerophosphatase A
MSEPSPNLPTTTTSSVAPPPRSDRRKPLIALAIATAFGLGYLPKAPGTFGSLAGLALAMIPFWLRMLATIKWPDGFGFSFGQTPTVDPVVFFQILLTVMLALVGVWSAHRAARYWSVKDPQKVVVDEISGQHLALLLGGFWPRHALPLVNFWSGMGLNGYLRWSSNPLGLNMWIAPNWKYLLLGFILFRVFDIWKPFPARQAESLPGGLGIMADDWVAGIYAALGLWIARALGL